ncbi:hypothetical protein K1719_003459 [Acacia pycnantha]|nr:hypothetical protein K1719_003459 [Acacia pycnantha]
MRPFRRTLIVKLLGRQPSYSFMVKKLRQIWKRKGQIDIFDLENDFYLVSFQHLDDYMEALTGGPWVILDAYLNVARWRPNFCLENAKIESVVAWVRLPDLPVPLFDKKFLLNLGNAIGKAIRLDIHTAQRARGKFARADKVQKEGVPNLQRKKGVNGGMGLKPRGVEKVMVNKEKTLEKEGQHSKLEKAKGQAIKKKPEGSGVALAEIQNKGWSIEGVPDSNPSLHKWNGVTRVDKENLHPGMFSDRAEGKVAIGIDGKRIDGDEGDPFEAYEMCPEEGGVVPVPC